MSLLNPPPVGPADFGRKADAPADTDSANTGFISLFKRLLSQVSTNWTSLLARVPTLGQKNAAGSLPVVMASDVTVPTSSPGGLAVVSSAAMVRPATTPTYSAGQLVANSATAGSVAPIQLPAIVRAAGEAVRIERIRLRKSGSTLTNAQFRVHLFNDLPTVSVGDTGTFNSSGALAIDSIAKRVGSFDVTMDFSASGAMGVGVPTNGSGVTVTPTSGTTLYALIEARGSYVASSGEQFVVIAEGLRP